MNMVEAVRSVLSQYANFSGRARRSEYWYWTLALFLAGIVAGVVDYAVDFPIVQIVITLGTLVPGFAVAARRLHDTGRSGWWQLLGLIPIIGWIILIVWYASDSHPDNEHGPNPQQIASGESGYSASPTI